MLRPYGVGASRHCAAMAWPYLGRRKKDASHPFGTNEQSAADRMAVKSHLSRTPAGAAAAWACWTSAWEVVYYALMVRRVDDLHRSRQAYAQYLARSVV